MPKKTLTNKRNRSVPPGRGGLNGYTAHKIIFVVFCLWVIGPAQADKRYSDRGDGTIIDRQTNLVILKNADCFGKKSWEIARVVVQALAQGMCGLTDGSKAGEWQLPDKSRLPSLMDWAKSGLFSGIQTHFYWSRTPYVGAPGWSWVVYLGNGHVGRDDGQNGNYIWPVRNR